MNGVQVIEKLAPKLEPVRNCKQEKTDVFFLLFDGLLENSSLIQTQEYVKEEDVDALALMNTFIPMQTLYQLPMEQEEQEVKCVTPNTNKSTLSVYLQESNQELSVDMELLKGPFGAMENPLEPEKLAAVLEEEPQAKNPLMPYFKPSGEDSPIMDIGDVSTGKGNNPELFLHVQKEALQELPQNLQVKEEPSFKKDHASFPLVSSFHQAGLDPNAFIEADALPKIYHDREVRQIAQHVIDYVTQSTVKGSREMDVHLQPRYLGDLHIHITEEENRLVIKIKASNEQVKKALDEKLPYITDNLKMQGVSIKEIECLRVEQKMDFVNLSNQFLEHKDRGHQRYFSEEKQNDLGKESVQSKDDNHVTLKRTTRYSVDLLA